MGTVFNAATFTTGSSTPATLLEYAGPVGQPGRGEDLRLRFGNWRRSPISGSRLYLLHDKQRTGFSYRNDLDIAFYPVLDFSIFKRGFIEGEEAALAELSANAIYFEKSDTSKYLGVDMVALLDRYSKYL
jgi:hypothetical protein